MYILSSRAKRAEIHDYGETMKKTVERAPIARLCPDPEKGLTAAEAEERKKKGYQNIIPDPSAKTYKKIFADNICTFFNLIWLIIFAVNLAILILRPDVTSIGHLFFIVVILANTALAIIQEIRAKRQVEQLALVVAPRIDVIRDGEHMLLPPEELVIDDIVCFETGSQIPADAVVVDGKAEMNESLLTGESDGIKKEAGDTVYAGSFVSAGGLRARIDKVGADSYIQQIAKAAKAFKSPNSDLFRDINRFIRVIGICILPFAALMFFNNYRTTGGDVYRALLATTGSVQGMIPAGMFLLITVALSIGVIKLKYKQTLVRDIYSVEMLSRTNMLCLDKTGTITDGTMRVACDRKLTEDVDIARAVAGIMAAQTSQNFTSQALIRHYTAEDIPAALYNIPFSSKRKYTATSLENFGTYAIGAPEFLNVGKLPDDILSEIDAYAKDGKRVLLLAKSDETLTEDALPPMTPAALIVLEDHIREEAYDTIRWFRENRVHIKIISGDNPITVASIARRVGVENADRCISLEGMTEEEVAGIADDYTVFGRVSPEQKHTLVKTLKAKGYVVAMTGDGVNDTLALKEADCSIAMADGSDVARGLSNIVLMNNNFASLPSVVCEGRQVVNNVQRASSLFLMKTFCVILLSVGCVIFGQKYPFETNMLTMLEVFVTGIPSVILALEPNKNLIEGSFLKQVLKKCVPDALLMFFATISVMIMHNGFGLFPDNAAYLSLLTLAFTMAGLVNLVFLCIPLNRFRIGTLAFAFIGLGLCAFVFSVLYHDLFDFGVSVLSREVLLTLGVIVLIAIPLHILLKFLWQKISAAVSGYAAKRAKN